MRFRWLIACVFFLIGLIAYMDRANISVVASFMMEEFSIDKTQFGLLNSAFFIAYAAAQIPSGILIQKFGNKFMTIFALILWSIFTILTPLAGTFMLLLVVRFLFGLGEAPIYPSNAAFNNNWFGKQEKARAASFLLAGSYFGPVIAPFISVWLVQNYGWHSVFYVFGVIGILIAIIYWFISSSKPEDNKFISKEELAYIQSERFVDNIKKTPWKVFLKNKEFYALGIAYFFCVYMTGMFMTWLPTFLLEAKGLDLKAMGFYAGAPWLAICIFVALGGGISDKILKISNSFKKARTYLAVAGFLIFDICLFLVIYVENTMLSILFLSLGFGFLGLPVVVSWAVAADKGRSQAAAVSSWMNLWGNVGSAFSPILVGWMAQKYGWNIAILFNIIPVTLAMIAYLFVKPDNALTQEN
ncbi:sugar transporter, major facilitator superfamily [Campylobacter sp. RM5004]|uniref:MFS transporter n=1 Tax=Campylobacter sp. RM5004 TaxID=1660078 RepID=UPI001EFBD496|nr:MFS transporter [Campylobacter sp. RM5004]ULO01166.1 sugar transporter, major facilitator superfamily [Campylobacter sp. RM5004]